MNGQLLPLPGGFASTRESLRAMACFVVAPARKARTGRIGLRPVGGGFGTPPFEDGSCIVVRSDEIAWVPGDSVALTTIRAAAGFVGLEASPDPGVGHDLPPFAPDDHLAVDGDASSVLGSWYLFAQDVIEALVAVFSGGTISEAQIWPEHFDLAVTVQVETGASVNVGFSPGDTFDAEPYAYVGPHDFAGGGGNGYWNAPFGAFLSYERLLLVDDPIGGALAFIVEGLSSLP